MPLPLPGALSCGGTFCDTPSVGTTLMGVVLHSGRPGKCSLAGSRRGPAATQSDGRLAARAIDAGAGRDDPRAAADRNADDHPAAWRICTSTRPIRKASGDRGPELDHRADAQRHRPLSIGSIPVCSSWRIATDRTRRLQRTTSREALVGMRARAGATAQNATEGAASPPAGRGAFQRAIAGAPRGLLSAGRAVAWQFFYR